jgi:predicted transcriptional regulator
MTNAAMRGVTMTKADFARKLGTTAASATAHLEEGTEYRVRVCGVHSRFHRDSQHPLVPWPAVLDYLQRNSETVTMERDATAVPECSLDQRRSIRIVVNGGVNSFAFGQAAPENDEEVESRLKKLQDHIETIVNMLSDDNRVLKRELTELAAEVTTARTGKRKRTADMVDTMTRRLRNVMDGADQEVEEVEEMADA